MKILSTISLMLALATLLYMNIGQIGGVCMTIGEAKNEAAQRMQTEALSTLSIPQADLLSGKAVIIDHKELRYNGSLYDIAQMSVQGDHVTFSLLHDEKEEGLISKLKDLIDGSVSATPKNSKSPVAKYIITLADYLPVYPLTLHLHCTCSSVTVTVPTLSHETPLSAVLKSPPKFI